MNTIKIYKNVDIERKTNYTVKKGEIEQHFKTLKEAKTFKKETMPYLYFNPVTFKLKKKNDLIRGHV